MRLQPPPESPMNFPEPSSPGAAADIHLRALTPMSSQTGAGGQSRSGSDDTTSRPPPAYSPLDAFRYQDGVEVDLPAEVIAAALNHESIPESAIGVGQNERHRSRRERRR